MQQVTKLIVRPCSLCKVVTSLSCSSSTRLSQASLSLVLYEVVTSLSGPLQGCHKLVTRLSGLLQGCHKLVRSSTRLSQACQVLNEIVTSLLGPLQGGHKLDKLLLKVVRKYQQACPNQLQPPTSLYKLGTTL